MPADTLSIGEANLNTMVSIHPGVITVKPQSDLINLLMNWSIGRRENLLVNRVDIPSVRRVIGTWEIESHGNVINRQIGGIPEVSAPDRFLYGMPLNGRAYLFLKLIRDSPRTDCRNSGDPRWNITPIRGKVPRLAENHHCGQETRDSANGPHGDNTLVFKPRKIGFHCATPSGISVSAGSLTRGT